MIWALLAMYLLGGGAGGSGGMLTSAGVEQLSARAEIVIADASRAEAAQKTLTELEKEAKAFEKTFAKSGKQLIKSYKDHASEVDLERIIQEDLNAGWKISQQRALDLRFELKESMREKEWAALFSPE
jgi:hypothetical protein